MSLAAMTWVFEQDIPASEKVVLFALADFANGDDWCFPGQVTLAAKACMSERTVRRLVAKLEERGLITRTERRSSGTGYRTSDGYQLHRLTSPDNVSGREISPDKSTISPDTDGHLTGQLCPVESEPSEEPSERTVRRERADAYTLTEYNLSQLFETAWKPWPKKADRKGAEAKFAKLLRDRKGVWWARGDELTGIIGEFGQAYRDTTDVKFVPHLTTWLNREGWNDDLPVAAAPVGAPKLSAHDARRQKLTAAWDQLGAEEAQNLSGEIEA